jgi:hypothetical protein
MGKELAALKAQPAPVQEPVAWMFQHDETGRMNYVGNDGIHNPTMFLEMNPRYALVCPLYTTPPAAQPAVPDALFRHAPEHPQYIEGWNDCRAEMLKGMK